MTDEDNDGEAVAGGGLRGASEFIWADEDPAWRRDMFQERQQLARDALLGVYERENELMRRGPAPISGFLNNPEIGPTAPMPDWLEPRIEGFDPQESEDRWPGGGSMKADGWQLMLTITKSPIFRVLFKRWERQGDNTPIDHRLVRRGRYRYRVPTNRRRKRERAKARRRERQE